MNFLDKNYPPIVIDKGELLQRKGIFNNNVYFVEKGLLRSYTIDEKGKEHIFMFGPEGWIVGDTVAFNEPCNLYIDALEPSVIKIIDKESAIFKSNQHNSLFKRINVLQKRVIMLMSAPAMDRYNYFLATYPSIINRIPQKMIASYLGLTPETLSKVKKEIIVNQKKTIS